MQKVKNTKNELGKFKVPNDKLKQGCFSKKKDKLGLQA